jgi:hypothetical protein
VIIERIWAEDIREKRKAARGVTHRASRNKGFKGGVRTPVDYMSTQEKRAYTAPSEVTTYYIEGSTKEGSTEEVSKGTVITRETFDSLTAEQKRKVIDDLRDEGMTQYKIAEQLGYQISAYYRMLRSIGYKLASTRPVKTTIPDTAAIETPTPVIESKFNIALSGVFDGKDLGDRILGLVSILSHNMHYKVELIITEEG